MAEKSNEWYTPTKYIEAAREVMGGIDLDPASCVLANQTVKASRFYSKEDDGLVQDWTCTSMWLNPPYGSTSGMGRTSGGGSTTKSIVRKFILKLLSAYEAGNIEQAILLVTTDTDASWFVPLWNYPICFATHQIRFLRPGLPTLPQFFGTCFVYLGTNEQKFVDTFSQFGRIARAIDTPRRVEKPIPLWDVERIYAH